MQDIGQFTIREIDSKEKKLIKEIAKVHVQTFKGFFLTFMGKGFLTTMYRAYCRHSDSSLLGAVSSEGQVLGFLAYSKNMSGLYKYMIKRSLLPFFWYSLCAFFRKPKVFVRLIRAFLKPSEAKREESYIELSSIGVSPDVKANGIGTQLINSLKDREKASGYNYISLETDAKDNEIANAFYKKNGFILERVYQTKEKREMNEYRFYLEQA